MKHMILLFGIALLLIGCAPAPSATPPTVTETPPVATAAPTQPTLPDGLYDPDSALEAATGGALQVFPLDSENYYGIRFMGDDLILLGYDGATTLTKLSGETLIPTATTTLESSFSFDGDSCQATDSGLTIYDDFTREIIVLDSSLRQVSHFSLPQQMQTTPVLSADCTQLYYCTDNALRVLDLQTKLDRLLKELYFSYQAPTTLHCDDTIIECITEDTQGNWSNLFISTETGETLWETPADLEVFTAGNSYFVSKFDSAYRQMLYSFDGGDPSLLAYPGTESVVIPLLEQNAAILLTADETTSALILDYYDLTTGHRVSSIQLPGDSWPFSFRAAPDSGSIYFMNYHADTDSTAIFRWFPEKSPTGDETCYFSPRYSYDNPDLAGLEQCAAKAADLSQRYHVQILLWQDAVRVSPWDYTLEAEYQVPLLLQYLEQLEEELSLYPSGFLKKAASGTANGTLQICIVRGIYGTAEAGSLDSVNGLQFWDDEENAYLCLAANALLAQNLHHELFHIIDSRVLSTCSAYDNWEQLNPADFQYDYDYLANLNRSGTQWLDDDTRAFIDHYSMSFPKEDRARIMEYAMQSGNESYFTSNTMQQKLHQLCVGIRKAFRLQKSSEVFQWEQYLQEPLAVPQS